MKKLLAGIRLMRPLNCMTGAAAVFVAAAITGSLSQTDALLNAILVVVLYNGAANSINDYCDYEIDRINRPERPLSSGILPRRTGLWLAVLLFILGTLLALQLNWPARAIAIGLSMPILIGYSTSLKGRPIVGNLAVALILALVFIFSGAVFSNIRPMIVPAILAFLLTFLRELVKDIADLDGDRQLGLWTFPIVAGDKKAAAVVRGWAIVTGIAMLVPAALNLYNLYYLGIVLAGIILPLGFVVWRFSRKPDRQTAVLTARLLKFSTIAGVLAVYLGS